MSLSHKISGCGGTLNRRSFIKLSAFGALYIFSAHPSLACPRGPLKSEKLLSLYNTHTGESLQAAYWSRGKYLPGSLAEINHIFRDHRTDEVKALDTQLLDLLHAIGMKLQTTQPFHIISGYRSPQTNELLHRRSNGVATNSLHMYGKAADVRIPGCTLSLLRRVAMDLRGGGVGYYPRANFVHVDVGCTRIW
jgi:uncharacterized protein YcbK (DUF882 family)